MSSSCSRPLSCSFLHTTSSAILRSAWFRCAASFICRKVYVLTSCSVLDVIPVAFAKLVAIPIATVKDYSFLRSREQSFHPAIMSQILATSSRVLPDSFAFVATRWRNMSKSVPSISRHGQNWFVLFPRLLQMLWMRSSCLPISVWTLLGPLSSTNLLFFGTSICSFPRDSSAA